MTIRILIKKKFHQCREAFAGFEPNIVAKMGENEIMEIASNKEIMLAESRVRSIVENAKCILKVSSQLTKSKGTKTLDNFKC